MYQNVEREEKKGNVAPLRRSNRKPRSEIVAKQWKQMKRILWLSRRRPNSFDDSQLGLAIKLYPGINRGIEARRVFVRGDFVVEIQGVHKKNVPVFF